MAKKSKSVVQHPDDMMLVSLSLAFLAKINPDARDPKQFGTMGVKYTMPAEEAPEYLDAVARAIRERRLYGFLAQKAAESAVDAGDWIERPIEETFGETATCEKGKNR